MKGPYHRLRTTACRLPWKPNRPPLNPELHELLQKALATVRSPVPQPVKATGLTKASVCGDPRCNGGYILNTHRRYVPCPVCQARARTAKFLDDIDPTGGAAQITLVGDGTPRRFSAVTWDDVQIEHKSWRASRRYAQRLGALLPARVSWIAAGPHGRGKSLAMSLILRTAAEDHRLSTRFITLAQLVSLFFKAYKSSHQVEEDIVAELAQVDVLGVDEVGGWSTRDGDFERRVFTQVINARDALNRVTLLTTNISEIDQLEHTLGTRAFERLYHTSALVAFDGPNYRESVDTTRTSRLVDSLFED